MRLISKPGVGRGLCDMGAPGKRASKGPTAPARSARASLICSHKDTGSSWAWAGTLRPPYQVRAKLAALGEPGRPGRRVRAEHDEPCHRPDLQPRCRHRDRCWGFIPIPSQTKSVNGTVYGFDPGVIDNATGPVRYNAAADVFPKHATQGTQLVDKNCSFWTLGTVKRLASRLATAGPAPAAI